MKKLWRPGVLIATMCIVGFCISSCSKPKEQPAKPEPKIKSVTRENIHGVIAPDEKNLWLVGNYGVIFYSSDGGETWTAQKSGVESLLIDGVFINAKVGWVAGIGGVILHTADGGVTWIRQKTNTDKHLFGICFLNEKLGWAVGEMGLIIATQDGGKTWAVQGQEQDKNLNNVAFVDQNTGVVVGETGTMLRTVDGGKTWTSIQPKIFERATIEEEIERPRQTLYGIIAKNKTTFVACGMDGLFLYSADAGAAWESFTADKNLGVYSLFVKGTKGWAVGDRGALFVSGDGGTSWKFQAGAIKTGWWLRDIAFVNPNKGIAVGSSDTIMLTDDGGKTWNSRAGIYYTVKDFPVGKDVTDKLYKPFNLFGSLWRKSLPEQY